jgi:hypothetical protein
MGVWIRKVINSINYLLFKTLGAELLKKKALVNKQVFFHVVVVP